MSGELIVSISGISAATREQAVSFADEMDQRGVNLSLLVAPRLKDKYILARDEVTQQWLRDRREVGDVIVLHGYDQAPTGRRRAEFAKLPEHEARLRLTAADRVMEQTGLRTRLFAAPRWNVSEGAVAALPGLGFRMVATLTGIHDLERDLVQKGRVFGIGEGFRAEPWWCRALVMGAGRIARRDGLLRLAISAKQLGQPGPRQAMLDAVDLALYHRAVPSVYSWTPWQAARAA
jgi:predicted deacetylase